MSRTTMSEKQINAPSSSKNNTRLSLVSGFMSVLLVSIAKPLLFRIPRTVEVCARKNAYALPIGKAFASPLSVGLDPQLLRIDRDTIMCPLYGTGDRLAILSQAEEAFLDPVVVDRHKARDVLHGSFLFRVSHFYLLDSYFVSLHQFCHNRQVDVVNVFVQVVPYFSEKIVIDNVEAILLRRQSGMHVDMARLM